VDYGPVVFPSHIGKVFHVKIVCLVLVVFGYIFSAYILLYFIVSYRFTQRGSFVYCCFSQHQDALEQLDDTNTSFITKNYDISTYVSAAMDDADTCDQSIEEMTPGKSPIGSQGTTFSQLCSIVLALAKQVNGKGR
jgi:hypothetical protein